MLLFLICTHWLPLLLQALKNLIFGTATSSFNVEWRNQSFTFCDLYNLEYGIVQLKVSYRLDVFARYVVIVDF